MTATDLALSNDRIENAKATLAAGADVLRNFINAMRDMGIQAQVLEVMVYAMPGQDDDTPRGIFSQAIQDVVHVGLFGDIGEFDGQKVVEGAASLELLVRYARLLHEQRPTVFLADDIPDAELVDACLVLFHLVRRDPAYSVTMA